MNKTVLIIGAGPAGLTAGHLLAKNGYQVTIYEKDKISGDKICAGGLTMDNFNLLLDSSAIDRQFKSIRINSRHQNFDFKYKKQTLLATTDRKRLGKIFTEYAVKTGVEIKFEQEVTAINFAENTLTLKGDHKEKFDYLIGADGSNSLVRRLLKIPTKQIITTFQYQVPKKFDQPALFFDGSKYGPGYCWIFPHKEHTSIGCGTYHKYFSPQKLLKNFQALLKELEIDYSSLPLQSFPINFDYCGIQPRKNIFLIGDACGITSGLTGEGILPAQISAISAASRILEPTYKCPELHSILRHKHIQEKFLFFVAKYPKHTTKIWEFLLFCSRLPYLKRKAIRLAF